MAKKRKKRGMKSEKVTSSPPTEQTPLKGHPPEQKPPQGPSPEHKPLQRPPKSPLKNAQKPERQESELECHVCYEPYQDTKDRTPRLLLCAHTFCTTCLSSLIKNDEPAPSRSVPLDKSIVSQQPSGTDTLKQLSTNDHVRANDHGVRPQTSHRTSHGDADGQWHKNKARRAPSGRVYVGAPRGGRSGYGSGPSGSGAGFSGGYWCSRTEPGSSDAPTWRNRQNKTSEQRLYSWQVDSWRDRRDNIHGRSRSEGQGGYRPNNPTVEVQVRAPTHQDRNSYLHYFGPKQPNPPSNPQLSLQNDPPPHRQQQASESVSQAGGKNRGWETVTPNKPQVTQNYNFSDSGPTSNDAKPTETKSTEPWTPKMRKIDKDEKFNPLGKAAEQNASATERNKMQVPSTPEVGGSKTSTGSPARSIECPICRFKTEIGGNGIETCKVNFALKRLIGVVKPVIGVVKPMIRCDECLERDASVWCDNCSEPLCFECKSENHETHRTPLVSNAENKQRNKIESLQNELRCRAEFLQDFDKHIAHSVDDSKQSQDSILDEITNTFNITRAAIIGALEDRKATLLEDSSSKYATSIHKLLEKRQQLASEFVQLNAAVEDSKRALGQKGLDFLGSLKEVNNKMSDALKSSTKGDTQIKRTNLTFINDKSALTEHISRLGSLKTSSETIKSPGNMVLKGESKDEVDGKQAAIDNEKLLVFDGNCSSKIVLSNGLRDAKCKTRNERPIWSNATTKEFEVTSDVLSWKVNWSSREGSLAVGVVPGEFKGNDYPGEEGYIYFTNMGNGILYNMRQSSTDTTCPKTGGCIQVCVDMAKEFVEIFVEGKSVGRSRDLKLFKSKKFRFIVSMHYKGGSVSVVS